MADLNAGIILQGTDTTHPVLPQPLGETLEQGARTGLMQAQAGATTVASQGEQLKNQLALMNLRNQQAWGQATMQAIAGIRQAHSQEMANNAQATVAADPSAPNTIDPSTPPAPPGVDPYAWKAAQDNNWTIDKSMDWYKDSDGNPVSHAAGPAFSPSGRPNLYSHEVLGAIADQAEKFGASPMFLYQTYQENADKALAFDKENASVAKNLSDMAEARARANNLGAQTSVIIQNTSRNHADDVMLSPDPAAQTRAALFQTQQMPKLWVPKLQAAGVQVTTDPGTGLVVANTADPRFLQVFSQEARVSPNALERAKLASENAERGIHIVNGTDADGNPTASVVKIDANTGAVTTQSTGLVPAGILTPAQVKSSGDQIINYDAPLPTASTPNAAKIRQYVQDNAPDYDATKYTLKLQARKDFSPGGSQGKNLIAIDTAINHLDTWYDAYQALQNHDIPKFNQLGNKLSSITGGAAPSAATLVSDIASDEVVKAVVGNISGEKEREHMQSLLNANALSPAQATELHDKVQELMSGRLKPLVFAAQKAGLKPDDLAISDNTRSLLNKGSQARPTVNMPKKAGDIIQDSKGVSWVYQGGDPNSQSSYKRGR